MIQTERKPILSILKYCNCLLDIFQRQAILDKSLRRGGLPSDLMVSIYAAKEHNLALVHLFYRLLLEAEFKQDKSVTISQGDSRLVWIHIQFNDSKIYMFQNICKTFPFSPCHLPFLVKIITMCFIKNNDMKWNYWWKVNILNFWGHLPKEVVFHERLSSFFKTFGLVP